MAKCTLKPGQGLLFATLWLTSCVTLGDSTGQDDAKPNEVLHYAAAHVSGSGPHLPNDAFLAALQAAAMHVPQAQHADLRSGERREKVQAQHAKMRSLVMLGMANEAALKLTVPVFLESLRRLTHEDSAGHERTLDSHMVLAVWSEMDMQLCEGLREPAEEGDGPPRAAYLHQCVHDKDHRVPAAGAPGQAQNFKFHSAAFNALGFAKIKYILNGLSAGHDVLFMDTDIVMLRNPVPHLVGSGADMATVVEKCVAVDDRWDFTLPKHLKVGLPAFNIGVLYYRATAGTARCVFNWFQDMWQEAHVRPTVWDQDVYRKVVHKCAQVAHVSWHALDPRVFQSACYLQCGCAFDDADRDLSHRLRMADPHPYINGTVTCGPQHWQDWVLMHFACSGGIDGKVAHMKALLEGVRAGEPAIINPPKGWKPQAEDNRRRDR